MQLFFAATGAAGSIRMVLATVNVFFIFSFFFFALAATGAAGSICMVLATVNVFFLFFSFGCHGCRQEYAHGLRQGA
jgi:hypothetical protein